MLRLLGTLAFRLIVMNKKKILLTIIFVISFIVFIVFGIILGVFIAYCREQERETVHWIPLETEQIYGVVRYPYDPEEEVSWPDVEDATDEELTEEAFYDSLETLAILVQAEADNQDLKGKQLVADVVLNRVDSPRFANSIEDVIFEQGQFSVIANGRFDKAARMNLTQSREAVEMEVFGERLDDKVLYFNTSSGDFKYGDHYFSY